MSQPVSRSRKTKHLAINQQQQQQRQGQRDYYHPEQSNASVPLSNKENALTIIAYINAMITEVNLSDNYRRDLILLLSTFSNYFQNKLPSKR